MFFKNSLNYFSQFFFFISNQIKNFYLNSKIYNKKISKISNKSLEYKPSPSLLDCLIKYEKKKIKIEDLYLMLILKVLHLTLVLYQKIFLQISLYMEIYLEE